MTYLHDNTWRVKALEEMGFSHGMENDEHLIAGHGIALRHTSLMCLLGRIVPASSASARIATQREFAEAAARHPRAWKLMQKGKPFIVIAHDEPYFAQVYATIRQHETDAGRWGADDEVAYQKAIAEPDARQFNLPYEG